MAAQCYRDGRIEDGLGYSEAGQLLTGSRRYDEAREEYQALLGALYVTRGEPEQFVESCRNLIARTSGPQISIRALLAMALKIAHVDDEAVAATDGLIADAAAADNPGALSFALLAYGFVHADDADTAVAYDALRRGLKIAQDSGNRQLVSIIAANLSRLAVIEGDATDAFEFVALAIRNYHDAGNLSLMVIPLALLAAFFDRLGRHESAATIAAFASSPLTETAYPEITIAISHLRDVLGDPTYESLARKGETMTTAAMVTYAYDQIDQARTELNAVSN
jgi:tetratricopeptide (TPR) repeat protein